MRRFAASGASVCAAHPRRSSADRCCFACSPTAYRLQAKLHGDLDRNSIRLLERIERERQRRRAGGERKRHPKAAPPIPPPPRPDLGPGTLLVREFAGQVHTVTVIADGFAWQGATYTSLSEVARAITGTRWNGPCFFGLRDKAGSTETATAQQARRPEGSR